MKACLCKAFIESYSMTDFAYNNIETYLVFVFKIGLQHPKNNEKKKVYFGC